MRGNRASLGTVTISKVRRLGCTGRNTHKDGAERGELVVEVPGLVNVAGLEGHLQAAVAHAEPHAVHVDVVRLGRPATLAVKVIGEGLDKGGGRVLVLEDWKVY